MGLIKAVGRWIGNLFVLCDWHADGSAQAHDDRGEKDAKRSWTSRHGGGHPLTPEKMAREPAATPAPPPKPSTPQRVYVKFIDENPDITREQWEAMMARSAPPVLQPIRHVKMLSLIQTYDEVTRGRLNTIRDRGAYDTTELLKKQWLGIGPDHIVVWDCDAVFALRDLVRATANELGGCQPELEVEVRWASGVHARITIDLRNANYLGQFGEAFERAAQRV